MDPLRIGMIGVGGRGGLWKNWHKPQGGRSVVVAGMDVRDDTLARFKEENGSQPFLTKDYQELVWRPDVDAVAICSPDYCHEDHAVAALQAGKHVFLEKPFAITTEGCDRILTTWQQSGMRMMVGHNMRYMNRFGGSKEFVS